MLKRNYLLHSLFLMCVVFFYGCAAGQGTNRHEYFPAENTISLPFKTAVDEDTKKFESAPIMGGENKNIQAFIAGGLPALMVTNSKTATGFIRGNFEAGKVFEQSVKAFSTEVVSDKTLDFKLVHFQQYLIPQKLQTEMKFEVKMNGASFSYAEYACTCNLKSSVFGPGKEKDLLHEIVERSVFHWGQAFLSNAGNTESDGFPAPVRGKFEGDGAECGFSIFN